MRGHENRFLPSITKLTWHVISVQGGSGRVSPVRPVLCWTHITFKLLLRRLRMKSLVTIASHTDRSLHVCRFSSESKKNWWMQTEKKKNSQGSPDTDVIWASPRGDGTRNQAQKGRGAFSIGHVLSSWLFHRLKYTLGTRSFSRVRREYSVWTEGRSHK